MLDYFKIGHWTNKTKGTGVSVVLAEKGATGGCYIFGGAPATRETDLLKDGKTVEKVNAVVLSGGSAFGLESADGVMKWLYERGFGYSSLGVNVPIVVGASLFDLTYKEFAYPDKTAGYAACDNATTDNFDCGNIGAGTGATVGKMLGMQNASKGGLGASAAADGKTEVGFVVAVNALGDVGTEGKTLAGLHVGGKNVSSKKLFRVLPKKFKNGNTTIGCLFTNAKLTKEQANKLAIVAAEGYKRCISPFATAFDGDAIFVLASCEVRADFDKLCALAPDVVERAILSSITKDED